MDILSLAKANKAKRAIQKVNVRIGSGVGLSYGSAKKRIEFLESKDPKVDPGMRVSALETNTHINLNKHNLRVETLLNKSRYSLKEAVVEDFDDSTGIDEVKSSSFKHDANSSSVSQADSNVMATVITTKEISLTDPSWMTVSAVTSASPTQQVEINLENGVLDNLVVTTGTLSVLKTGTQFAKQGTWTSNAIDFTDQMIKLTKASITSTVPVNASVLIETAGSSDGVVFGAFTALDANGLIRSGNSRYLKIRMTLTSVETVKAAALVYDFIASEQAVYQTVNGVLLDGSLRLQPSYDKSMTILSQPQEGGTILSSPLNVAEYQAFEKIDVI